MYNSSSYEEWLKLKLNFIEKNMKLGTTISQALYLSGCSGQIPKGIELKKT